MESQKNKDCYERDSKWRHQIHGRDEELKLLIDAWHKAKSGKPQIVTLLADSGFGKTRIIQAFYSWLSQNEDGIGFDGYWPDQLDINDKDLVITPEITDSQRSNEIPWLWWALRWNDPDRNRVPYSLNTYLEEMLIHSHPIEQWRKMRGLGVDAMKTAGSLVCSIIPFVGAAVEVGTVAFESIGLLKKYIKLNNQSTSLKDIENEQRNKASDLCFDFLSTILDTEKKDSRTFPVVVVLDDAQWMDSLSLEMVNQLFPRAVRNKWPLLIVSTHWEAEWYKNLQGNENDEEEGLAPKTFSSLLSSFQDVDLLKKWSPIVLTKLQDEYQERIVHSALPNLNDQQVLRIIDKVDGNPLYLGIFLERLEKSKRNFIDQDRAKPLSKEGENVLNKALEQDREGLLRDIFDDLPEEMRLLLRHASYQGVRFISNLTIEIALRLKEFDTNDEAKKTLKNAAHPENIISELSKSVYEFRQRGYYEVALDVFETGDVEAYCKVMVVVILEWFEAERFELLNEADKENIYKLLVQHSVHVTNSMLPQLNRVYSELGTMQMSKFQYKDATDNFSRSLRLSKKLYSPDHPNMAKILSQYADALGSAGEEKHACRLYRRALIIREAKYGYNHPDVASSLNGLAEILKSINKYKEALPLHERALAIREANFGFMHPAVAQSLSNLADTIYRLQDPENSLPLIPLHERALAIEEEVLGLDHPDVAGTLIHLANVHSTIHGQYEESLALLQRALAITGNSYGSDHPQYGYISYRLANTYLEVNKPDSALQMYRQALNIYKDIAGPDCQDVLNAISGIAKALSKIDETDGSSFLQEKMIDILESIYGVENSNVAKNLKRIALIFSELKQYDESLLLHKSALEIYESLYESVHPNIAISLQYVGYDLERLGRKDEALQFYKRVLSIHEKTLELKHPYMIRSLENLGRINYRLGNHELAFKYFESSSNDKKIALEKYNDVILSSLLDNSSVDEFKNIIRDYPDDDLREMRKKINEWRLSKGKKLVDLQKSLLALNIMKGDESQLKAVTARVKLGLNYQKIGHHSQAIKELEDSLSSFDKTFCTDQSVITAIHRGLGLSYFSVKHYDKVIEHYESAIGLGKKIDDDEYRKLAFSYSNDGQYEKSLELFKNILGDLQENPKSDKLIIARGKYWVGHELFSLMKYNEALPYLLEAQNVYQETEKAQRKDSTNWYLGINYLELNQPGSAKPLLEEELRMTQFRKGLESTEFGIVLAALSRALYSLGDHESAIENFDFAIEIINQADNKPNRFKGMYLYHYACAELTAGKNEDAIEKLKDSISILEITAGKKNSNTIRSLLKFEEFLGSKIK